MNIYLVKAIGSVGYDALHSFVMIANSQKEVECYIQDLPENEYFVRGTSYLAFTTPLKRGFTVERISFYTGPELNPFILLASTTGS